MRRETQCCTSKLISDGALQIKSMRCIVVEPLKSTFQTGGELK